MLVLQILIAIVAIILIISVMMQKADSDGVSALTGGNSDTFLGKNQTSTLEGKLALVTKISAAVFVVLAILIMIVA